MSSDLDYNLKKTIRIGQLYPVLLDVKGNIIDGKHRMEVDPNWKSIILPEVDTEEKRIIYSIIANLQRRKVPPEEKAELINSLAEIYNIQGYKVLITGNEIVKKIVEVTGLSQPTVNKFLDDDYKVYTSKDRKRKPRIPAAERIRRKLGKDVLERYEQEVNNKPTPVSSEELLEEKRKKLENKRKRIVNKLPDEEDRKTLSEEVKQYSLTPEQIQKRVSEIQDSQAGFEPALPTMFVEKAKLVMDRICKPLERFEKIDVSALNDLDAEQKGEVLAVLLESQKKITEWIEAIRGHAI